MRARVSGLEELKKKLAKMPAVAKARIRTAMEQGAGEIVKLAKTLVPKDSHDLENSIAWTWGKAPKGSISIGSVKETGGDLTITIYAGDDKAFYARWVEFGTKPHNTAKGGGNKSFSGDAVGHPGMAAQPFFYVSYRALRKRTVSRITRATNKAAKQVATRS